MELKDALGIAFTIGNASHYKVKIDANEAKDMTYIDLGLFLMNNVNRIEIIKIKIKEVKD